MKYYLVAGERSGDLHGSNLIKSLKEQDPKAQFRGIGGDLMQAEGLDVIIPYSKLAFMGFWEVIANLSTIKKNLRDAQTDLVEYQPDVLILIDYPGFNLRMARFAHSKGVKVYYYISPKIWAWNTKRAFKIKKWVDRMFTILPFETEFYKGFGIEVDYVGNPVMDAVSNYSFDDTFAEKNSIDIDKTIAVLPGSRRQEVKSFSTQIVNIAKKMNDYVFTVSVVDNLSEELYNPLRNVPNIKLVEGNTYDLLKNSKAAIITSGTATLETAILNIPQVVGYKTSAFTYAIAKRLVKVPFISLVNLIMNKEVVKELIQDDLNTDNLWCQLNKILNDQDTRDRMLSDYEQLRIVLGSECVSGVAAKKIYSYLMYS